ncbi:type I restriction endonuclease subunit R [Lachnospiraceae bacterium 48-33]
MGYQSETDLEKNLIDKLSKLGFIPVKIKDYDELLLNFREQMNKFNKDKLNGTDLTNLEFERLKTGISGKTVFQCAKQLRDLFPLDREDGTTVYLEFFSKYPEKNIWQVTNQVTVTGRYKNRYDVTVLANGVPVIQIELKRAGVDIKEAINQIDRYRVHSYKGLFHFVQYYVVSNAVETRYFSNTDDLRIMKSLTFYWTDENNRRINNLDEFSVEFLNPNRITKMICKYIVLTESDKNMIIMRPYQIYATEAVVDRALSSERGGFVWHTTGSGKTLTSWKCANLLIQEQKIKKVFFLVDRNDLDTQTMAEFNRFEPDCVDATDKTYKLVNQIEDSNVKLIISTIQKMTKAINKPKYAAKLAQYKDEKVIFIIDECHRSQFGKMHTAIKNYFTKAQYFGFTGTPLFPENKSQDGRTTADIFGDCLHKYMIKEAIFDKNVLGFSVEYISTYKGQYDAEDETLVEAIDTTEVIESDKRINLVANHIISCHNNKTRIKGNTYTSIFAVSSIDMLMKYYDKFKSIDHDLKIVGVFSFGTNEDLEDKEEHSKDQLERLMKDYNDMFDTNFNTDTFAGYNADISKRMKMKKASYIDILLVVNMYLTGFDSRPLNTLYVDKNLEWHSLLQAFSRTNRVEKETKQFGNIVCFRNLKKKTDAALRLFSGGGDVSEVLLKPYSYYVRKFKELLGVLFKIVPTPDDVDLLQSEDDQAKFVIAFRELSKVLLTLETFSDFTWEDLLPEITQQEYENYKSKYFTIHDAVKKRREAERVSILADIDFAIELIETDKINVAYIMNLLKNVDWEHKEQKERDIAHIFDELDRSDSPELRKKVDLIKAFLEKVAPIAVVGDSVLEMYAEFEDEQRNKEIEEFAQVNGVDVIYLEKLITEYSFSGILDNSQIKKELRGDLGFKQLRELVAKVTQFIIENCEKYGV